MDIEFSKHAMEQMELRGISHAEVMFVLRSPGQVIREVNYVIFQSVVDGGGQRFLFRIFVNDHRSPNLVITVYKTTKINKYYEGEI